LGNFIHRECKKKELFLSHPEWLQYRVTNLSADSKEVSSFWNVLSSRASIVGNNLKRLTSALTPAYLRIVERMAIPHIQIIELFSWVITVSVYHYWMAAYEIAA
jgi:hypothetical protein